MFSKYRVFVWGIPAGYDTNSEDQPDKCPKCSEYIYRSEKTRGKGWSHFDNNRAEAGSRERECPKCGEVYLTEPKFSPYYDWVEKETIITSAPIGSDAFWDEMDRRALTNSIHPNGTSRNERLTRPAELVRDLFHSYPEEFDGVWKNLQIATERNATGFAAFVPAEKDVMMTKKKPRRFMIRDHFSPAYAELYFNADSENHALAQWKKFVETTPPKRYLHHCIALVDKPEKQEVIEVTHIRDCDGWYINGVPASGEIETVHLPRVFYSCEGEDHEEGCGSDELMYINAGELSKDSKPLWMCINCYEGETYGAYIDFKEGKGRKPRDWEKHETLKSYLARLNISPETGK